MTLGYHNVLLSFRINMIVQRSMAFSAQGEKVLQGIIFDIPVPMVYASPIASTSADRGTTMCNVNVPGHPIQMRFAVPLSHGLPTFHFSCS